jgi:hypothetical protein
MAYKPTGTGALPRLDAFDQEFGGEAGTVLPEVRRQLRWSTLAGWVLGAVILSVAALAWLSADTLRSAAPPAPTMSLQSASREAPDEEVARLAQEIATLRSELGRLALAHQQALERIALLQADQQSRASPPLASWYSDLPALIFESAGQPRPSAVAPPARRAVTARPESREPRRRESAEPLPLGAPR